MQTITLDCKYGQYRKCRKAFYGDTQSRYLYVSRHARRKLPALYRISFHRSATLRQRECEPTQPWYVACSWRQINNPIRRATREALPGEDTHRVRWQSLGPQFHGHTHLVTMSVLAHRQSLLNWCTNQNTRHICRSQRVTATSAHRLLGHLCPIRTSHLLRFVSHQHSDVC